MVENQDPDHRIILLQPFYGVIGGSIVGNEDLRLVATVLYHVGQVLLKHLPSVPIENHYCCFHCEEKYIFL